VRRVVIGSAGAVTLALALGAAMFPVRSQLSVSTAALVLVIPVVVGVAVGGFGAGVVGAGAGFLIYDLVFIPPYYTLSIGAAQNWVGLGVYAIVTVVVTRVVAAVSVARTEAQERATELRRLFDLSELLVRESPMPQLLDTVVAAVQQAFSLDGAALLLPVDGRLRLVASAGLPLTEPERQQLSANVGVPVSLETAIVAPGDVQAVALTASDEAIGLLALRGLNRARPDHELLRAFANHLALALQRAQLREQAVRAQLLDEIDRLRRALVGAVSHDLRTPLATIKVAASTLLDSSAALSGPDAKELLGLIDLQADRLNRLVSNLLDMTRIQSGALELRRARTALPQLLEDALAALGSAAEVGRVQWEAPVDLPDVDVDPVLICQVLANLIDNATRYAPGDTEITVTARRGWGPHVEVAVSDQGPGVADGERATIFRLFNPGQAGGRGGLGLAIAQAFVEAHGERIWLARTPASGARFVFTLPTAGEEEAV
jgi:two-component system sensor histidine kinase KdpD